MEGTPQENTAQETAFSPGASESNSALQFPLKKGTEKIDMGEVRLFSLFTGASTENEMEPHWPRPSCQET